MGRAGAGEIGTRERWRFGSFPDIVDGARFDQPTMAGTAMERFCRWKISWRNFSSRTVGEKWRTAAVTNVQGLAEERRLQSYPSAYQW
jgi:hypothetical protein